jgi:hypothetical protein
MEQKKSEIIGKTQPFLGLILYSATKMYNQKLRRASSLNAGQDEPLVRTDSRMPSSYPKGVPIRVLENIKRMYNIKGKFDLILYFKFKKVRISNS